MSIKTLFLAGAVGAAMLSSPVAASEPVKLSDTQMENVTAGLDFIRARFNVDDVRTRNVTAGNSSLLFNNIASDDTVADATTGFLSQALAAISSADYFVSAANPAGVQVNLDMWNQRSQIQY